MLIYMCSHTQTPRPIGVTEKWVSLLAHPLLHRNNYQITKHKNTHGHHTHTHTHSPFDTFSLETEHTDTHTNTHTQTSTHRIWCLVPWRMNSCIVYGPLQVDEIHWGYVRTIWHYIREWDGEHMNWLIRNARRCLCYTHISIRIVHVCVRFVWMYVFPVRFCLMPLLWWEPLLDNTLLFWNFSSWIFRLHSGRSQWQRKREGELWGLLSSVFGCQKRHYLP